MIHPVVYMIDKAIERHRSESNLTKGKVYIVVVLSIYNKNKNTQYHTIILIYGLVWLGKVW